MDTDVELSIVIPAWNERENLEVLIPALDRVIARLGVRAEIVVADAGSPDGTAEAARRLGAVAVQQVERGYGGAVLMGFDTSRAPWVITMDADLSHEPSFIEELWSHFHDHTDEFEAKHWPRGTRREEGLDRAIGDFLCGMTDRYAMRLYQELRLPKPWTVY